MADANIKRCIKRRSCGGLGFTEGGALSKMVRTQWADHMNCTLVWFLVNHAPTNSISVLNTWASNRSAYNQFLALSCFTKKNSQIMIFLYWSELFDFFFFLLFLFLGLVFHFPFCGGELNLYGGLGGGIPWGDLDFNF